MIDFTYLSLVGTNGSCGSMTLGYLYRESKEQVDDMTNLVREKASHAGVVLTTCREVTSQQEKWMIEAGWQKILTYAGQYKTWNYRLKKELPYPMTVWALVLKPYEETEVV